MKKCLFCYSELSKNEIDFHASCSKKMFGTPTPPILDFDRENITDLAKKIVVKSVAITGVQPKLSLQMEKQKNQNPRLTLVGLYGDFILKPQSDEYSELPENESVTMHLAGIFGIKTVKHSLIRLKSGELAYITKRFDREKGEKIAVEDFCQLSENLTEHKYRSSIEKVGKIAFQFVENKGFELQKLFELVVFCFLTGNADMHLKNFSLMKNKFGFYEFSPAYDLLSTALVIAEDKEETALTINGKKNKLKKNDFDTLGKSFGISEKVLNTIYKKIEKTLPKWTDFIEKSFLSKEIKQKYLDLIFQKSQLFFNIE